MSLHLSLFYGLRHLTGKKKGGEKRARHLVIPVLSIALSIIPVIVILVVSNGMIEGIILRYLEFETAHLRLTLHQPSDIALIERRLPDLKNAPGLTAAYLEIQGGGLVYARGRRSFINIRGVPKDLFRQDPGFARYAKLAEGAFDLEHRNSIVIGKALAAELGVKTGDRLFVITHRSSPDGGGFIPRPNRFTITGVYTIGYQELDKRTVFISDADGRTVLSPGNSETHLKLKVPDPFTDIEGQAFAWEKAIDPRARFLRLESWSEINSNYYNALQSTKALLVFIMLFIVFVAAFNIISSMIMIVLDRLQEIGILKSLGASAGSITLAYVCVGFVTGLVSVVGGVAAGLFIAVHINELFQGIDRILTALSGFGAAVLYPFTGSAVSEPVTILNPEYYLETIPIRIDFWEVFGIGLFALLLSVFFSFFPSRMAGGIRPLEVIRKH